MLSHVIIILNGCVIFYQRSTIIYLTTPLLFDVYVCYISCNYRECCKEVAYDSSFCP